MTGTSSAGPAQNFNGTRVPRCACQLTLLKTMVAIPTSALSSPARHVAERHSRHPPKGGTAAANSSASALLRDDEVILHRKHVRHAIRPQPARFLSVSLSATPSSVTFPFFTMMWIDGTAESA